MKKRLLILKLALAAVLLILILLEWGYSNGSENAFEKRLNEQAAQPYRDRRLPALAEDRPPLTQFSAMVERPLFIEGRRPAEDEEISVTPGGGQTPAAVSGPLTWELTGVYFDGQRLRALLRATSPRPDQKNHRKLTIDDELDGWRIENIETDRLILTANGERRLLILQKPKPTTPAPDAKDKPASATNPFAAKIAEAQKKLANQPKTTNHEP